MARAQDLLVASIFRNFILAERLLRSVNCTPVSVPRLPPSYQHPLWAAWDLAADVCLAQLPDLLSNPNAEYQHSTFFTEQLTAFEVWLEFGSNSKSKPLELPIVLQVLLSQVHRLRALMLLARFLDMGSWAVNHALSVGIFPYVLKLLSSPALELKEALVFIWTKILTVDKTCQIDLIRDLGYLSPKIFECVNAFLANRCGWPGAWTASKDGKHSTINAFWLTDLTAHAQARLLFECALVARESRQPAGYEPRRYERHSLRLL